MQYSYVDFMVLYIFELKLLCLLTSEWAQGGESSSLGGMAPCGDDSDPGIR